MLELLSPEFRNIGRQFGVVVAQIVQLLLIMAIYFSFDSVCAGQRRFLRHQGRRRAKRKARHVPERL